MRHTLIVIASVMLAACDIGSTASVRAPEQAKAEFQVAPGDFAVEPCSDETNSPCALVHAGGKSFLFGAPAGLSGDLTAERLANLDGSLLFSLLPRDIEGLDEVRNRGWRAGRADALVVAGPEGTGEMLEALNLAYEQPDALSFVDEGAPRGGFDAALLQGGVEVLSQALAFDTGDVKVVGLAASGPYITYRIGYRDLSGNWHDLVLRPCTGPEAAAADYESAPRSQTVLSCDGEGADMAWPLTEPVKISG
ncbi:MAG: hypothetical protein WA989_08270 [Henriciella sp.]|uniref:hypothetical protein n=1 Tax=Henriciella sp. TaxID=1968823 RepID=UPI003C77D478